MKTFYEFFAGGGMARLGLGEDWKCTFANDIDAKKAGVYRSNFPQGPMHVCDVGALRVRDLPGKAALAWASFPCQDLSLAGRGEGLDGTRSGTFWPFWTLMRGLAKQRRSPTAVVLENVYGAITSNKGRDFLSICEAISEGYRFGAVVIDAVHFVPQSRPRLFIIAVDQRVRLPYGVSRSDPSVLWHPRSLVEAKCMLPKKLQDHWVWWDMPAPPPRRQVLFDLIDAEPSGVSWDSEEQTKSLLKMMSPLNWAKVQSAQKEGTFKVGGLYKRTRGGVQRAEVRFDDVSGCLRTPGGGSSRQRIVVVEGKRIRSRLISSREAARLMGLSDAYGLPANYNEAYHLVGDGVVVPAVRFLTENILDRVAVASSAAIPIAA